MTGVERIGAHGDDEHDLRRVEGAGEEADELARRAIGPLEVLDDEHRWLPLPEAAEQPEHLAEEARLRHAQLRLRLGERRAELGEEARQVVARSPDHLERCRVAGGRLLDERLQRLEDRHVWQVRLVDLHRRAAQGAAAARTDDGAEVVDEAALADARLALHDDHRGGDAGDGTVVGRQQAGHLVLAADEDRARPWAHHPPIIAPPSRRRLRRHRSCPHTPPRMSERTSWREHQDRWEAERLRPALERGPERHARFLTQSGVEVDRLATPADLADPANDPDLGRPRYRFSPREDGASSPWDEINDLGLPGEPPFTRGIHPTGYRGRLWTMRMFAGFGTAEDTNERFK